MRKHDQIWAVVPVKRLSQSKQRLMPVLSDRQRAALMCAMVHDTLTALGNVADLDGILVVTQSQRISRIAADFSAEVFAESPAANQSQAVAEAARHLLNARGVRTALMVPGDVPQITSNDVDEIIGSHESVTLVPDRRGTGTNAVMISPPDAIPFQFGRGSLHLHYESARVAGLSPAILPNENFSHDIDEPQDLSDAFRQLSPSHTREYLTQIGFTPTITTHPARQTVAANC